MVLLCVFTFGTEWASVWMVKFIIPQTCKLQNHYIVMYANGLTQIGKKHLEESSLKWWYGLTQQSSRVCYKFHRGFYYRKGMVSVGGK